MAKITALALLASACLAVCAPSRPDGVLVSNSFSAVGVEAISVAELSAIARIRVRSSPAKVFSAFADANEMSKFWFTRRDSGLKAGELCTWYIGNGENAVSFDVRVIEMAHASRIVIEWQNRDEYTQVTWSFQATGDGDTILTIEESGFTGSSDSIVNRVIDSTGGFNQVIIAAKALVEYGVEINVVADHG